MKKRDTMPPATEKISPVVAHSAEASQHTTGVTSLGSRCVAEGAEQLLGHPGLGHRGDGVGLDVVLAALVGQHPGEADQAHLGRAVVGLAEVAQDARVGRRVDDAAVALLPHEHVGRLRHVERALEVHVDDGLEQLGGHVVEGLVPQDAGVVDDDVDGAERVDGGLHDGLAAFGGGDAVGVGDGLAAQVVDLLGGGVGRALGVALAAHRAAEVVDDDACAPPGQLQGVLTSEAAAGPRDDRHLAVVSDVCHCCLAS